MRRKIGSAEGGVAAVVPQAARWAVLLFTPDGYSVGIGEVCATSAGTTLGARITLSIPCPLADEQARRALLRERIGSIRMFWPDEFADAADLSDSESNKAEEG